MTHHRTATSPQQEDLVAQQLLLTCLHAHEQLLPPLIETAKAEGTDFIWALSKSLRDLFGTVLYGKVCYANTWSMQNMRRMYQPEHT